MKNFSEILFQNYYFCFFNLNKILNFLLLEKKIGSPYPSGFSWFFKLSTPGGQQKVSF